MSVRDQVVEIASLQRGENRFDLVPNEAARQAIADRIAEPEVKALSGAFILQPFSGGLLLDLHLIARVARICVASLEPMEEAIDEHYAIRFERGYTESDAGDAADDETAREPLYSETLDLEEILIQHLAISLAPHPRKADAASLAETYRDPVNLSPFSVLKGRVDGDT